MEETVDPYPPVIEGCRECGCFKFVLYYGIEEPVCADCLKGVEPDDVHTGKD